MIAIVNVKTASPGSFEYCGRRNSTYNLLQSSLANPFKLEQDTPEERIVAVAQYREWLYERLQASDKAVVDEIGRLADLAQQDDVALGCWCEPKRPCHCEVIADFVRRELAGRSARIAAYGSADARTPADYTLREAIDAMVKQDGDMKKVGKKRRYDPEIAIANDGVTGPVFESGVSE